MNALLNFKVGFVAKKEDLNGIQPLTPLTFSVLPAGMSWVFWQITTYMTGAYHKPCMIVYSSIIVFDRNMMNFTESLFPSIFVRLCFFHHHVLWLLSQITYSYSLSSISGHFAIEYTTSDLYPVQRLATVARNFVVSS